MSGKNLSRRTFSASLLAPVSSLLTPAASTRPNIVFLCADQHSGNITTPRTPNLDRLASRGVRYRNAYCASPVCVPARAAMMTGLYPSDVASYCNSTSFDGRVPTWGNYLRNGGYRCWATGKLDLTEGKDYGFEEFRTDHGHSRSPDITSLFRAPLCYRDERKQVDGQFRDRTPADEGKVSDALDFLRSNKSRPFALYAGLHMPHPAFIAHKKYADLYPPERAALPNLPAGYLDRRHEAFNALANFKMISRPIPEDRIRRCRSAYYAMVTELDALLGRLLDAIDYENTLVVYTSDHGEMLGEHGLWLKNVLLENAARVPLILAGPGLPKGQVVDSPVSHVDMVATVLDAANVPRPQNLRGHSLLHGLPPFTYAESHSEGNVTGSFLIRQGDWKYVYFSWLDPLLFNLKDDPGELNNLASTHPQKLQELHQLLTSQVNPDQVTKAAFAAQDKVLQAMIHTLSAGQFYKELEGRLGPAQAHGITERLYRKRALP
ncbi:MAG: sulfatase-like hydrolase/transferase [Acidobacteria bacterium]|nr:sulfatase-like hydrolase/transferase [Acidobacteriota bacterium]